MLAIINHDRIFDFSIAALHSFPISKCVFIARLIGEESEDEEIVDEDDAKNSTDDRLGSMQNENSLSPPPSMPAISATQLPSQVAVLGKTVQSTSVDAPSPNYRKKRHRSHDSQEVEEVVSSPKKHHSHRPLGLPGANIKIENRGNF